MASKCTVMSLFNKRAAVDKPDAAYYIKQAQIERVDTIKDLGVVFDSNLIFAEHVSEKINTAYSMLGIIKRNFQFLSRKCFVMLYKTMIRSRLEYANSVWAPI